MRLSSSLYLKSRGYWVRMSHWIGLCFLKPENVSPSCRNIIVSMLWKMNFYIQLLYEHVLTCCRKKLVGGGELRVPSALPHATAPTRSRIPSMTRLPAICIPLSFKLHGYNLHRLFFSEPPASLTEKYLSHVITKLS